MEHGTIGTYKIYTPFSQGFRFTKSILFGLHVKYTGDSEINPCRYMDVTSVDADGRFRFQRSRSIRAVHNTYRGTHSVCRVLGCLSTRVSRDYGIFVLE